MKRKRMCPRTSHDLSSRLVCEVYQYHYRTIQTNTHTERVMNPDITLFNQNRQQHTGANYVHMV
jgi:hypothetical protein